MLDWATLSLVKGPGAEQGAAKTGRLSSGRYLLTATGHMQNSGTKFVTVGENDVTTAGHFEGSAGAAPLLCEGVPATLRLKGIAAERAKVYALDTRGERKAEIAVESNNGDAQFQIGPTARTIWYEVVIE